MLDDNKIQLIKYREGIDKKTSKPYIYHELVPNIEISSIQSLFSNLERIASLIQKMRDGTFIILTPIARLPS